MRAKFSVLEQTHGVRFPAKFRLDQFNGHKTVVVPAVVCVYETAAAAGRPSADDHCTSTAAGGTAGPAADNGRELVSQHSPTDAAATAAAAAGQHPPGVDVAQPRRLPGGGAVATTTVSRSLHVAAESTAPDAVRDGAIAADNVQSGRADDAGSAAWIRTKP